MATLYNYCHLHLSDNVHYLPPPPPSKFCTTFQVVFHFSWILQPSQEKLKIMLMQNFGEKRRRIMGDVQVAYIAVLFFIGPDFVSVNNLKMLDLLQVDLSQVFKSERSKRASMSEVVQRPSERRSLEA